MRLLSRAVSALVAAAAVAGILFGVPIALVLLVPPVVGRVVPEGMSVVDLLLRPDDGTLLMAFLALVGACAWFVLAVSIVGELVAALTHRSAPRINLPGFGLGRSIASALVAVMLGAGPAMAGPAAAVTSSELVQTEATAAALASVAVARSDPEPTGPVHVVVARDTLWRIAETALGDPLRWREIYDLNAGREQADGGRLTEASLLGVGWRLVLPADAREVIRVKPGDTLTGLAAEHLGDPARADVLFAANTATPQPAGGVLADPDLIHPGWTLSLPRAPLPHADPSPPAVPMPETTRPPQDGTAAAPVVPVVPPEPDHVTTSAPSTPQPTPVPGPDVAASSGAEDPGPDLSIAALGVSSLVVGGMLTALAVRRRRQLRHRPSRHRIAVPADEPGRVEWSAAQQVTPTSSTRHLDLALRSLAHHDRGHVPIPVLRSARLTSTDALVTLAESTSLPAPFVAVGEHDHWHLDAAEPLPVPAEEAAGCCAPFPTLVSVATDDDRTLLIDLEQRGVLRIGGDHARCIALLRHIAAELATSHTAEDTEVLLVGLGDELAALNPEQVLVVPDLPAALTEIEHRTASVSVELQRLEIRSAVEGRLRDVAADSWLPTVLLVGHQPDEEERVRLDALSSADPGSSAVAVVVFDPSGAELRIEDGGLLDLPDVDDGPWQAAQLTENAGTHLAAILGATAEPPIPVGRADNPEPWASGMQDDGSLDDPVNDEGAELEIPLPRQPEPTSDPDAARRLAIVDYQDPHLDDDLTAWHGSGQPSVPMIAILGEPTVRAPGPPPTARPSWFAEVLVYLALHPVGVTTSKAVTDLWSDGHRISPATIRHALYGARRWAGQGYGGDPDATFVSGMQNDSSYRLRGHLLDWDLFRRLRKRAQARHAAGHPGAVPDYTAALNLIRGPVFSGLRPGGYAWLNNHDQRHDLQIPGFIVDTAHELVDIALAAQDTVLARRAAEYARMVDIDVAFDRPLIDLMRIAHAEDNRSELEMYATVLLDARGFDVPEELAPDSFAVLNELLPAGLRRPRP